MERIAPHRYFRAISDIEVAGGVTNMCGDKHLDLVRLQLLEEAANLIGCDRCWEAIKMIKDAEDKEEAFQVLRLYLSV